MNILNLHISVDSEHLTDSYYIQKFKPIKNLLELGDPDGEEYFKKTIKGTNQEMLELLVSLDKMITYGIQITGCYGYMTEMIEHYRRLVYLETLKTIKKDGVLLGVSSDSRLTTLKYDMFGENIYVCLYITQHTKYLNDEEDPDLKELGFYGFNSFYIIDQPQYEWDDMNCFGECEENEGGW